jgi:hypothetical protein
MTDDEKRRRQREAVRRYRERHPERVRAAQRRASKKRPVSQVLLYNARQRAKRKGLPFTITEHDIVVPAVCPVLGLPLVSHRTGKGFQSNSPTLDRICPVKGYIPGNVRVISFRANLLKNDADPSELRAVLADLENQDACV